METNDYNKKLDALSEIVKIAGNAIISSANEDVDAAFDEIKEIIASTGNSSVNGNLEFCGVKFNKMKVAPGKIIFAGMRRGSAGNLDRFLEIVAEKEKIGGTQVFVKENNMDLFSIYSYLNFSTTCKIALAALKKALKERKRHHRIHKEKKQRERIEK